MNEFPTLQAEHLTGIVTGVNINGAEYPMSAMLGTSLDEETPTDAVSWDEILPNRNLVKTFESRGANATNTDYAGFRKKSATLVGSFKKRQVKPEKLLGLRAIGTGSADVAPLSQHVDMMLGDMDRRYRLEPMEYLWLAALQDNISITVDGQAMTPDYGLASDHDLEVDTDWSDPAADIDADVETCVRVVMQDSGETVTDAWCGRNVLGYLRKNDTVKSWLQNFVGADTRFDALVKGKTLSMFGLTWHSMDRGTHVSDVWTPYLNANKVIFTPAFSKRWLMRATGPVIYPTRVIGGGINDVGVGSGVVTYVLWTTDPVAMWVYHRWFALPVLTFPSAVCNLAVVGL